MPITVVIVDRRRLVREALSALASATPGLDVVATLVGVADVTDQLRQVDVVLLGELAHDAPAATFQGAVVRLADHRRWSEVVDALLGACVPTVPRDLAPVVTLTPREVIVLAEASSGKSALEIAATLGISARTVERHTQSAMAKLGVRSKAHAVARSLELRLLGNAG